jgi:hypothetical protein
MRRRLSGLSSKSPKAVDGAGRLFHLALAQGWAVCNSTRRTALADSSCAFCRSDRCPPQHLRARQDT